MRAEVEARVASLQQIVAEVRHPPPAFTEAQALLRAGRYADAEAAFTAYLVGAPNSRLADVALHGAATAAAMQGNCSMATAHAARLRSRHPASPLAVRAAGLPQDCRRWRKARLAP